MGQHSIPPWMIPTKPEQPVQIPLPTPETPSTYDRHRREESDPDRSPFPIDIDGNDGEEGDKGSRTYRF